MVEPPVTVGLGLNSAAILMSLTILSSMRLGSAHLKTWLVRGLCKSQTAK